LQKLMLLLQRLALRFYKGHRHLPRRRLYLGIAVITGITGTTVA
jgi:hypothetical protein